MAWAKWIELTAQDFMKITYITQIYENQFVLAADLQRYMQKNVILAPISTSRGYAQQPFPAYLNLVENNQKQIFSTATWNTARGASRTWLGEWADTPTFCFADVNRWFNDLENLKITVDYAKKPRLVSGTFRSGNARQAQIIRRR